MRPQRDARGRARVAAADGAPAAPAMVAQREEERAQEKREEDENTDWIQSIVLDCVRVKREV